jgi:hypothetical protein
LQRPEVQAKLQAHAKAVTGKKLSDEHKVSYVQESIVSKAFVGDVKQGSQEVTGSWAFALFLALC